MEYKHRIHKSGKSLCKISVLHIVYIIYILFVPQTYLLHIPDSCRFLYCSVSISIFCHVVWQSWPNHMAEYGNGREEGGGGGGPYHV